MKQILSECRQPREVKQIDTVINCLKDVRDDIENDEIILNLKTNQEIKELF